VIRRLLRRLADRAFVGAPPAVRPPPAQEAVRWTGATLDPGGGEPEPEVLEVEHPVAGSLLLDIREPGEMASGVAAGAILLPMDLVPHHLDRLPRDRDITVYCAAGARSWGVAHWLREQGFGRAWSLAGGVGAAGPMVVPAGGPGRMVELPAGWVEGAWVPAQRGEVIELTDLGLRCRVRDPQGFWVERIESGPTG
jgi:rhodanese-related sulfurtransferase